MYVLYIFSYSVIRMHISIFFSHSFLEGHVYWCIKAQELEPSKVEFKNKICYILVTFSRFLTLKFSLLMCFSQENTHYFYLWKRLKTSGSCTESIQFTVRKLLCHISFIFQRGIKDLHLHQGTVLPN